MTHAFSEPAPLLSMPVAAALLARLPQTRMVGSSSAVAAASSASTSRGPISTRRDQLRALEVDHEIDSYRRENDQLRLQLAHVINDLDVPMKPIQRTGVARRTVALEHELALLRNEIGLLEASLADDPSDFETLLGASPLTVSDQIGANLSHTIEHLEHAVRWQAIKLRDERRRLERSDAALREARHYNALLARQVDVGQARRAAVSPDEILTRARRKNAKISQVFGTLTSDLVSFIDERLASRGGLDAKERKGKTGGRSADTLDIRAYSQSATEDKGLQLKQVLENLMNRAVTSPTDPFIAVDVPGARIAPGLIDFLLRAGIAKEHPRDARRVRLVEFGKRIGE